MIDLTKTVGSAEAKGWSYAAREGYRVRARCERCGIDLPLSVNEDGQQWIVRVCGCGGPGEIRITEVDE